MTLFSDKEHIVRWAWSTHGTHERKIAALRSDLVVVRLRNRSEVRAWLEGPLSGR